MASRPSEHSSNIPSERSEQTGSGEKVSSSGPKMEANIHDEASAYLAAIVESANDAIISMNLDGTVTSWNAAAERIYGYRAEEMIGQSVMKLIPPDCAAEEEMILGKIRRGERVDHYETVRLRKDGTPAAISLTVSPVRDRRGLVIGASKIARVDTEHTLTARVRQQRAVAELGLAALREENLQIFLDRVTAEVARTLEVELCTVLELLPGGNEFFSRAGVGWREGLVGYMKIGAGRDSQAGFTLLSNEPVIVDDLTVETRFKGPDPLREHGVMSGASCAILGQPGRPWGVIGVHSRSRRHFAEDDVVFLQAVANVMASAIQRRRSEEQFRLAFEAAPNGMVTVDEAGSIRMVNTQMERLFGYTREEMLGQSIEMLLPERFRGTHPGQRKMFFHSPEARAMGHGRDLFARRKDGSEFPVEVGLNPAETPEGIFVLAAVIDISQRKRMEAELAQAHDELEHHARDLEAMVAERTDHLQQTIAELEGVSYSLSHDMRAPLRTIRSFSQIVLEEAGEKVTPVQKGLLEKVINSAGRLDRLIQDVLIYSRVSRDAIVLADLDLEGLLRQIIEERPEFQPPGAEIALETPFVPVRGHEAYLTQCITNLLDNAVKFVPPERKPRVRIWSEPVGGGQVRLYFEDNGPGVPKEAQERVFGIFHRIHDEKVPGTGIGLAIVRRAVERMGGTAGVEPAPGEGSRFWLQLQGGRKG